MRRLALLICLPVLLFAAWSLVEEVQDCDGLCIYPEPGGVRLGNIHPLGGLVYVVATGWRAISGDGSVRIGVNSGGGDFPTARLMAAWTAFLARHRPVQVELAANDRCGSSCTLIWAAAPRRLADRNGVFFFHAVRWAFISDPGWRFVGLAGQTRVMAEAVTAIDRQLAHYLDARHAYDGQGHDVTLLASDIQALGGPYVTVRP